MRTNRSLPLISLLIASLVLPVKSFAELSKEKITFFQSTLNQVNKSPLEYTCGAIVHEQNNCSRIFNLFERDKSTGLFFGMISDSPWDSCKKVAPSSKEVSLLELEKKLAEDKRTGLGLRANFFNSRATECFFKSSKPNESENESQKKFAVSMGYDYLNRIKKSTAAYADEIKKINSIIGDPIAKDIPCGQFSMPLDAKICLGIKNQKCAPKNELGLYTDSLIENAIEPLVALKKAYKDLSDGFSKTRTLRKHANQEALKNLTNKMIFIESQFPILKGKSLASYIATNVNGSGLIPDRNQLMEKVKEQLLENRTNISKKLTENVNMNNCLIYGDSSYCKNFEENVERIPRHEEVYFFSTDKQANSTLRLKNLAVTELYNSTQCMDDFRGQIGRAHV